jgi:hypothetical protein
MRLKKIWHTLNAHTMATKQPDPWTPRWVREKSREYINALSPSDPNRDNEPLIGEDPNRFVALIECERGYCYDMQRSNSYQETIKNLRPIACHVSTMLATLVMSRCPLLFITHQS